VEANGAGGTAGAGGLSAGPEEVCGAVATAGAGGLVIRGLSEEAAGAITGLTDPASLPVTVCGFNADLIRGPDAEVLAAGWTVGLGAVCVGGLAAELGGAGMLYGLAGSFTGFAGELVAGVAAVRPVAAIVDPGLVGGVAATLSAPLFG